MKKLLFVLCISLALVFVADHVLGASTNDQQDPKIVYTVRPVEKGADIYFLDLVQLRDDWLKQAGDAHSFAYGPEARRLIRDFDAILAKALATWRAAMRRYYYDVVSVVPVHNNSDDSRTTGLILFMKRDIPQATQR